MRRFSGETTGQFGGRWAYRLESHSTVQSGRRFGANHPFTCNGAPCALRMGHGRVRTHLIAYKCQIQYQEVEIYGKSS